MLEVMFSGKYQTKTSNDEYFIDRDGKLFRLVISLYFCCRFLTFE